MATLVAMFLCKDSPSHDDAVLVAAGPAVDGRGAVRTGVVRIAAVGWIVLAIEGRGMVRTVF